MKAQQPGARAGRWTEEEHAEFLRLHAIHGRKWTLIAEDMPFRTEPQIRSHAQKAPILCENQPVRDCVDGVGA